DRTKRFWNRFPFNSSFESVQSWLESFMMFYNYWRC
ncbi:IS6 family transposase, partial [Archaeoglobales archaeon]